ncbi:hypothetical protein AK812_SmicGene26320 [Symbiodinium microadriaticum]|uniref:Uncharacterized protein n=1 Tax=Symbiodinium microadriaticum TaxID=2951 RepID=A0A1Q9D9S7_SYMMI|nr:hypothetical protein AK812_SmicGene26320 [Symbiodinium microadriaticum]
MASLLPHMPSTYKLDVCSSALRVAAPVLAGLLMDSFGGPSAFLFQAILFLAAVVGLTLRQRRWDKDTCDADLLSGGQPWCDLGGYHAATYVRLIEAPDLVDPTLRPFLLASKIQEKLPALFQHHSTAMLSHRAWQRTLAVLRFSYKVRPYIFASDNNCAGQWCFFEPCEEFCPTELCFDARIDWVIDGKEVVPIYVGNSKASVDGGVYLEYGCDRNRTVGCLAMRIAMELLCAAADANILEISRSLSRITMAAVMATISADCDDSWFFRPATLWNFLSIAHDTAGGISTVDEAGSTDPGAPQRARSWFTNAWALASERSSLRWDGPELAVCPVQLEHGATLSCRGLELSAASRHVQDQRRPSNVTLVVVDHGWISEGLGKPKFATMAYESRAKPGFFATASPAPRADLASWFWLGVPEGKHGELMRLKELSDQPLLFLSQLLVCRGYGGALPLYVLQEGRHLAFEA